jgi:hypothetical protein
MNSLLAASLLAFLLGLGTFLVRGLDAHVAAGKADAELSARCDALDDTLGQVRPVSRSRLSELERSVRDTGRKVDEQLSILLDPLDAPRPPDWPTVLGTTGLPSLQPEAALRAELEALVAADSELATAMAALVEVLDAEGAFDLEDLTDLGSAPWEGLPELISRRLECVVLAELPVALAVLERLVPKPGPLQLSVSAASVRRVVPGLWPTDPSGLSSPPVRLWFRLDATHRAPPEAP